LAFAKVVAAAEAEAVFVAEGSDGAAGEEEGVASMAEERNRGMISGTDFGPEFVNDRKASAATGLEGAAKKAVGSEGDRRWLQNGAGWIVHAMRGPAAPIVDEGSAAGEQPWRA
jgi:hypothetical protein